MIKNRISMEELARELPIIEKECEAFNIEDGQCYIHKGDKTEIIHLIVETATGYINVRYKITKVLTRLDAINFILDSHCGCVYFLNSLDRTLAGQKK